MNEYAAIIADQRAGDLFCGEGGMRHGRNGPGEVEAVAQTTGEQLGARVGDDDAAASAGA